MVSLTGFYLPSQSLSRLCNRWCMPLRRRGLIASTGCCTVYGVPHEGRSTPRLFSWLQLPFSSSQADFQDGNYRLAAVAHWRLVIGVDAKQSIIIVDKARRLMQNANSSPILPLRVDRVTLGDIAKNSFLMVTYCCTADVQGCTKNAPNVRIPIHVIQCKSIPEQLAKVSGEYFARPVAIKGFMVDSQLATVAAYPDYYKTTLITAGQCISTERHTIFLKLQSPRIKRFDSLYLMIMMFHSWCKSIICIDCQTMCYAMTCDLQYDGCMNLWMQTAVL